MPLRLPHVCQQRELPELQPAGGFQRAEPNNRALFVHPGLLRQQDRHLSALSFRLRELRVGYFVPLVRGWLLSEQRQPLPHILPCALLPIRPLQPLSAMRL
jgi:hypothetical protein